MASWEATFESDTVLATPAATVSGSYGTLTYYSAPAGNAYDAYVVDAANSGVGSSGIQSGSKALELWGAYTPYTAMYYTTSGIAATTYFRLYVRLGAAPSANVIIGMVRNASTRYNLVGITSDRRLYVSAYSNDPITTSGNGGVNYTSSANAIPLNEWVRIEGCLTATTAQGRVWKTTGGNGYDATGPADIDSGSQSSTSLGTLTQLDLGLQSTAGFTTGSAFYNLDKLGLDDTAWFTSNAVTIAATPSTTATLTAAAGKVTTAQAALSTTATATAAGSRPVAAQAALTATAASSSDAATITTHSAEAYLAATGALTPDTRRDRVADVSLTTAASLSGIAATNDSAVLAASASMTAWVRIDGEQSPGQLKSRVRTTTITG